MVATVCVGCHRVYQRAAGDRGRCPTCRAVWNRERNARRGHYRNGWPAESKRIVAAWVAEHGWVCPGYRVPAHTSADLTADHQPESGRPVLCRSCNGRRGAIDPVFTSRR